MDKNELELKVGVRDAVRPSMRDTTIVKIEVRTSSWILCNELIPSSWNHPLHLPFPSLIHHIEYQSMKRLLLVLPFSPSLFLIMNNLLSTHSLDQMHLVSALPSLPSLIPSSIQLFVLIPQREFSPSLVQSTLNNNESSSSKQQQRGKKRRRRRRVLLLWLR